ncbi:hypothetical protein KJ855_00630 [Patescibacteria group bacterium]|nr:hypothetical protein [Patescibacteria group bacterium]
MKRLEQLFKYLIGLVVVIAFRLIPHPPNVEPIMSTMIPFGKKWGWLSGMIFCLLSILIYDVITGTLGSWSILTAGTYAFLGAMAGLWLKNRPGFWHYIGFAIVGTIFYDFITGVVGSTWLWGMDFMVALTGQIPFTLNHLAGNIILSAIWSPILYKWIVDNKQLETSQLADKVKLAFGQKKS